MRKVTIKLQTDDGQKIKLDCSQDAEEIRDYLVKSGLTVREMTPVMNMVFFAGKLLEA
jgi:hypothetical protein